MSIILGGESHAETEARRPLYQALMLITMAGRAHPEISAGLLLKGRLSDKEFAVCGRVGHIAHLSGGRLAACCCNSKSIPSMFKREKVQLFLFLVLIGLQVLGIIGLLTRFRIAYLPIMLAIFFLGGICTTLYLHRYLTHRGFEMPEWLKFIFATGSAVTLAGDPVMWVGDHRYHHLKSDTEEDIHSPIHGFPYAHMMWLVRKPRGFRERSARYAADVRKIWYCHLWEHSALYVLPHLAVALVLYFSFGFSGMLWCLYVPMLFVYNVTWAVNSICHMPKLGYRTFETSDQSRNNFWVGLLGMGEGFHNNHHAQPRCAAHGLRWWEFDGTRYFIWMLEKCGLAWDVVWPKAVDERDEEPEGLTAISTAASQPGEPA